MQTDIEPVGAPIDPSVHRIDPMTIHTIEQYEAATRPVHILNGYPEGRPEEVEIEVLVEAIFEWDKARDDATWRKCPVGSVL